MQDYHKLEMWNRAMDYVVDVYEFVGTLPVQEKYNLASQLRRAATSAPLNIAEGCGTPSSADFCRFLGFAYRSLKETVTALELCERLYPTLSRHRTHALIEEGNRISKMTYALRRQVERGSNRQLRTQY